MSGSARFGGAALACVLLLIACLLPGVAAAQTPEPVAFPKTALTIETSSGPVGFTVELARGDKALQRGLMFRKTLAPDAGMLLDYEKPSWAGIWMKNTFIPLDLLFIDAGGRIVFIHEGAQPHSETVVWAPRQVRAVLEVNAGSARFLGLKTGDLVRHEMFGTAKPKTGEK